MTEKKQPEFTRIIDLASEKLGGKTLACSDDFFAPMENLIKGGRGVFTEGKYTDRGKWMDGWESRRRRAPGHDWCIIKLGAAGVIKGLDIDTNHFLGNHPPFTTVDATSIDAHQPSDLFRSDEILWSEILPNSPLEPGSQNFFYISSSKIWTHLRLNIYPDGGIARFKVYGNVQPNWNDVDPGEPIDLAAAVNGGLAVLCNDMFFSHMNNLIMPGSGENMGDGWETKRNRNPENVDWVIVKLAAKGLIEKVMVDTKHFKGNYPAFCAIDGCTCENTVFEDNNANWKELLPKLPLKPDAEHHFEKEILNKGPFTHVKLKIYPDGGISRLRLFGFAKI